MTSSPVFFFLSLIGFRYVEFCGKQKNVNVERNARDENGNDLFLLRCSFVVNCCRFTDLSLPFDQTEKLVFNLIVTAVHDNLFNTKSKSQITILETLDKC